MRPQPSSVCNVRFGHLRVPALFTLSCRSRFCGTWSVVDTLDQVHARIAAPTQLVWGADDPFFPLPLAERMATQFAGGASLSVLRPGKLLAHEEFPDSLVAACLPFLRKQLASEDLPRPAGTA